MYTPSLPNVCSATVKSVLRIVFRYCSVHRKMPCSLGGVVSCGMPYSQSSSSQSINGVTSKRTVLEFSLSGSRSNATAQVEAIEDASRKRDIKIRVSFLQSHACVVQHCGLGPAVVRRGNSFGSRFEWRRSYDRRGMERCLRQAIRIRSSVIVVPNPHVKSINWRCCYHVCYVRLVYPHV